MNWPPNRIGNQVKKKSDIELSKELTEDQVKVYEILTGVKWKERFSMVILVFIVVFSIAIFLPFDFIDNWVRGGLVVVDGLMIYNTRAVFKHYFPSKT